jgi:hypothetical protein
VYSDARVIAFVESNFIPVRVHARDDKDEFERLGQRYDAQWTPTTLVIDPDGKSRHKIEGFVPREDFLSQLELGLAQSAFGRSKFDEAEQRFRAVVEEYPKTDAAAEAQYWAGVSRYKGSGDAAALQDTARRFKERYTESVWAKKASVWGD